MNIVIRTDASIEIGTGHVMRCLTLAKQLKRHGADVTFVCRKLEGNSISHLQSENMKVLTLPKINQSGNDLDWAKENWKLDAKETSSLLKETTPNIDLMIVDHYAFDQNWEQMLKNQANQILVIDDLADRNHDCDFLLDQNYYINMEERYKGLVPEHCVLMLGPDYVLLREEFIEAAKNQRERTGQVGNLLIFFGGTDPTGETIKTLNAIMELDVSFENIDVVVGASNPQKVQIQQLCKEIPHTHYYCQVNNMAELMMKADLSIGAGGSTTWERCFLGLPSVVFIVAENQRELTKTLIGKEVLLCANSDSLDSNENLAMILKEITCVPLKLLTISERSQEIVNPEKVKMYPVVQTVLEGYYEHS